MEIYSSILARRITWTGELGELQSTGVAKNQTYLRDSHIYMQEGKGSHDGIGLMAF